MSYTLSAADQTHLSAEEQAQIRALKKAWAAANEAGDQAAMTRANQQAEAIRAGKGYAGGHDGSGYHRLDGEAAAVPAGAGQTAQQVQQWLDDYTYTNYNNQKGWINGYSTDMNNRSMANFIRQQMKANSDAWAGADEAGKAYLHDQNLQLAKLLEQSVGGVQSRYNEQLGRWETDNANLGYGYNTGQYNDPDWYKNFYGMTDEQMERFRSDTDRYYNFVDQQLIRNWVDETSGYTGVYAQFVNGPYGQLMEGTKGVDRDVYVDVQGDGVGGEDYVMPRDEQGNLSPQAPYLKHNNTMSDYTKQFASYVENGVILPGMLVRTHPGRREQGSIGNSTAAGFVPVGAGAGQDGSDLLDRWQQAAKEQVITTHDHAVDKAVQQLLAAQTEAEQLYKNQRDQISRDEYNALDNAALYAEARGDRGGIGQTQYSHIQAQAAANRQTVSEAQARLAADTNRQIIQLRAEGEFEKADSLLEISQTYLMKLLELEQWAAEYQLSTQKFQASVSQWQQEFLMKAAQLLM